ncbi:hypothetical protein MMC20_002992 [Loxospora ochrophaea]|nr:hypothetical protein [Loxospora ochrophaea]
MSACDPTLTSPIRPFFAAESPAVQELIARLNLLKHPEGGYYVETDRDPLRVPSPFRPNGTASTSEKYLGGKDESTRSASTTIYYLLTPGSPKGIFHRNKARTIHTLHRGRGRYVVIHADEAQEAQKARIETFVVGHDMRAGERLQWLVEGDKYKASFLLPDRDGAAESEGLLISETVVPGFEFSDHNFMPPEVLPQLVSPEQYEELKWLLPEPN